MIDEKRLREMAAAGESDVAIGRALGVTPETIQRNRKRMGIPSLWQPKRSGHGTAARYNAGCRCETCRSAGTERARRAREKRFGKEPPAHGLGGYRNWGCRCEECTAAQAQANRRTAERARAGQISHLRNGATSACPCQECRRRTLERARDTWRHWQDESLSVARRHRFEWTGPELELAARADLTAREVAEMTGRTFQAVINARHKIRIDPRKARLAGLDTDTARKAAP